MALRDRNRTISRGLFVCYFFCFAFAFGVIPGGGGRAADSETTINNNNNNNHINDGNSENNNKNGRGFGQKRHQRWADAAYEFVGKQNCKEVFVMTVKDCKLVKSRDKSEMNVYIAEPSSRGRFSAVLPDGGLSKSGKHDSVVVIDPFPAANFGHLTIVFYLDTDTTWSICTVEGGTYLGNGECLSLALKKRCKNALSRRRRRRNFHRRCEINFLPIVYLSSDASRRQRLNCRDDVIGFKRCPQLRPKNETARIVCNALRDNTKRCETTQETIKTSCRMFEICDQAVLISGGWNRQTGQPRHRGNLVNMFNMLANHGFVKKNIKIFYANGATKLSAESDENLEIHPAAMKLAMRYHIKKMCVTPHCVDSLVIYLNNPGLSDGTSLLWDANSDGIMEEHERYSVEELLSDLDGCTARQVHLIADQSYSGEIARAFQKSTASHANVIVFASGSDNEYSWASDFTEHWASYDHTHSCTRNAHLASADKVRFSRPEVGESLLNHVNATIFGAPCDVTPRFSDKELRQQYLGCQNLPTALWFEKVVNAKKTDPSSQLSNIDS
ncbi:uncharacterized protein LOC141912224 [Tubulanus polymorphus]|uniref:uncharacterized protein LOC141912224 n=1 Tax=Tubulanus polymorphus TaxID=672921 RepID=UPI003DA5B628